MSGKAWKPGVFSSAFYYRVRALKLPELCVQGLRHSFATVMLRAGVGIKTVSEALGHSTIVLTGNTYSHVLDSMRREAAGKVDDVMSGILAKRAGV